MQSELVRYVWGHTQIDEDIIGAVDLVICHVAPTGMPIAEKLREHVQAHPPRFFKFDPLDGQWHGWLKLASWLGDEEDWFGSALRLVGLGELMGLWEVKTPKDNPWLPLFLQQNLANSGMIEIRAMVPRKEPKC